jgi:hypothetical protein
MRTACLTAIKDASGQKLRSVTRSTQVGSTNSSVITKIKAMYANPQAVLPKWLGISKRTAKRKLDGDREFSAEEIGKLIRSERGFEIITAIMADHRPEWWRICAPLMDAVDIRKMQIAAQRRIKKIQESAIDADKSLSDSIARADALAFQDEKFAGPYRDALGAMGRSPDSAVAQRTRR